MNTPSSAPRAKRIFRPGEAAHYLAVSRATIYRLEAAGKLAPRLILGPGSSGWRLEDLDAFLDSLPRAGAA